MDTRFWGPSGWKMLHLITFQYDPNKQKSKMRLFLKTLPFVLPCKYCRASLTDYYEKHPFEEHLTSREKLIKWLYIIHNEVNEKLRSQGLNPHKNPSFDAVKQYYIKWIATSSPWERLSTFWDFLLSVGYCHPTDAQKSSTPMPNCPRFANTCKSKKIRNRWNTLKISDRLHYYKQFWFYLPDVMEPVLKNAWKKSLEITRPNLYNRKTIIAWLWRMRCSLDSNYHDPYTQLCKQISTYSSDCSKSKSTRTITCRKKRT
jgi:hypothetical protein